MLQFVCLSVCLSVRSHNSKTTQPNFTEFVCVLPVAVAWSCSDGVVIRYELSVLWMTSCFHIMANGVLCVFVSGDGTRQVAEIPTKFRSTIKTGSAARFIACKRKSFENRV